MRTLLLALLLLSSAARATHLLQFHVYVEREWLQGPWIRTAELGPAGRYLHPVTHEATLGTTRTQVPGALLAALSGEAPERYRWPFSLDAGWDTVILDLEARPEAWSTVRDEVTASMDAAGWPVTVWRFPGDTLVTHRGDVRLPLLDLTRANVPSPEEPDAGPGDTAEVSPPGGPEAGPRSPRNTEARLRNGLLFSLALNLLLGLWVVRGYRRRKG